MQICTGHFIPIIIIKMAISGTFEHSNRISESRINEIKRKQYFKYKYI